MFNTRKKAKKDIIINDKTPVISRSLFINQKTNSHDKLLLPLKLQLICHITNLGNI